MVLLTIDKTTNKWKQITVDEKKQLPEAEQARVLYIDGELQKRLNFAKKQIAMNNDCIGIVSGGEGTGKSSLAGNIMRYISEDKFDPRKQLIGADYQEALEKLQEVEDNGWLMFDEGNAFFLSTETMSREHRDLHKVFSIFRQKRLFVLIILPSFFRLGSYFANDRSKFMIRTYLNDGKRGFFAYYGEKRKNKAYKLCRKDHDYALVKPNFRGRFHQCISLEDKKYKDFKLKTLNEAFNKAREVHKTPTQIKREVMQELIVSNPELSSIELSKVLKLADSTIRNIRLKRLNEPKTLENTPPSC